MLHKAGINAYSLLVVTFVAISTIGSAYGLAIIGSTVGQPNFYTYFDLARPGEPGYAHTTRIIGALNGVNSGGAVVGSLLQAWTADYFGRKRTIQLGCLILVIGGALCGGAVNMAMFIVGRGIAGAGSAILTCVVPTYQAEVSAAETRGAMVSVTGIMYAWGYSLAAWLGFACYYTPTPGPLSSFAWRFPLSVQTLFPLIVLLGSYTIPYSPRWLLQKGRHHEAWEVVKRLHKSPDDPNDTRAREEYYMIDKQVEFDKSLNLRRFELFRTRANIRRAAVAFLLMWGDQFLGVYVLANYGVLIYANLGLGGSLPLLLNACSNSLTIIGNTWTAFYVDRYGRRKFLLIGSTMCIVSIIFLCALTAQYLGTNNTAGLRAAVFFIFFFVFWWCFFMDATQYIYVAEIFPNHLRAQGVAFGLSSFYLSSEVTLVAAPIALNAIGWRFYLVLIIPSVVYVAIIWFFFPETKGRTLEEIGALFGDEVNVASHWYDATEEDRARIATEALAMEMKGSDEDTGESGEAKPTAMHLDTQETVEQKT